LRLFAPWRPTRLAAAILPPTLFFLVNDRVVAPTEEAMLRRLHPKAFGASRGAGSDGGGRASERAAQSERPLFG